MPRYAAFLRAVNVGGRGKLPMADLRALCDGAGFGQVQTYIASGNIALHSDLSAPEVQAKLEAALLDYAGHPVAVLVRKPQELNQILASNPYAAHPGNQVMALLLNTPAAPGDLDAPKGQKDEQLSLGAREIYVYFPSGMGQSRLQIPHADVGTARNMNTIAKMASMLED